MSKWDEWIQPEEDTELLIYEEWIRYIEYGECPSQRSKIDVEPIASEDSP